MLVSKYSLKTLSRIKLEAEVYASEYRRSNKIKRALGELKVRYSERIFAPGRFLSLAIQKKVDRLVLLFG